MAHLSLSPPTPATQSPPITQGIQSPMTGSCCTSCGGEGITSIKPPESLPSIRPFELIGLHKLGNDLERLLSVLPNNDYSDAVIEADGLSIPVHRCILAARSPFFREYFAKNQTQRTSVSQEELKDLPKKVQIAMSDIFKNKRVGNEILSIVLRFIYGGRLEDLEGQTPACMDPLCLHESCGPVIEFYLELLCAASVFDIPEFKSLAQQCLMNLVDKAIAENVLEILVAAHDHNVMQLQDHCIELLVHSNIEVITLEKQLAPQIAEAILAFRHRLGLLGEDSLDVVQYKVCRRIYKALDSDDLELMQLLLKESNLTMDAAYALHYAVSYCDVKTISEVLELDLADVNARNRRGCTLLYVASFRREPEIIASLLAKGAHVTDITPDGYTALQLSKRLAKNLKENKSMEGREDHLRARICVEVLEQAEKPNPCPVFPPPDEGDFIARLLYLENRVAFARLLFPHEFKVVFTLSRLACTKEFSVTKKVGEKGMRMDLNEEPPNSTTTEHEGIEKGHLERLQALQAAIEVGHRLFPRCTPMLNKYMDDGSYEHALIQNKRIPENSLMKRRRLNEESQPESDEISVFTVFGGDMWMALLWPSSPA